jgi:hypothetical protein
MGDLKFLPRAFPDAVADALWRRIDYSSGRVSARTGILIIATASVALWAFVAVLASYLGA